MPIRQQDPLPEQHDPANDGPNDNTFASTTRRTPPRQVILDDPPLPPPTAIRGWYRRIGTSIALIGAALIGGLMWYYGGVFTLDFLSATIAQVGALVRGTPWWQHWWIPLVISAIEIFLWPRRERRIAIWLLRLGLWLAVLAFDVLTTMRGVLPGISHQALPFLRDPEVRRWLDLGVSGGVGVACAYVPEKIARWVLSDLWNLWVAPLIRRLRRWRAQPEVQPVG